VREAASKFLRAPARPSGQLDLNFVGVNTSSLCTMNFNSLDGGETDFVLMRWLSPTGKRGVKSEQAQVTFAAQRVPATTMTRNSLG